ncbi:uncharacterized protein LOC143143379 isoform X2 [Ptiloglossa arizonensis]|uniref:uncharacterized protein LOC143143379 isoform X2 n=1 Tax=Ptiloglossa arizonensis TaxID=3350558 RepID=UPI003F9FD9C0
MENAQSNAQNIFHFEKRFHKMIYQIQRYTEELDKLEREHVLMREQLYSKESLLQNEQRISHNLRARLKLGVETIERLEEEKMRNKIDYSKMKINYDSIIKERDLLAKEALSSQMEVAKFKIKMKSLENKLQQETRKKGELEKAIIEMKNDNEKIIANINMNIVKILKEHKYLVESTKSIIQLNKRLQTFGLCSHAINEKNRKEIKDLQMKLIAFSINELKSVSTIDKLHPEIETLCFKLKEMSMELKSKMQNSTVLEENLNKFFQELFYKHNTNQGKIFEQTN